MVAEQGLRGAFHSCFGVDLFPAGERTYSGLRGLSAFTNRADRTAAAHNSSISRSASRTPVVPPSTL
jgi:hypothetical protein